MAECNLPATYMGNFRRKVRMILPDTRIEMSLDGWLQIPLSLTSEF